MEASCLVLFCDTCHYVRYFDLGNRIGATGKAIRHRSKRRHSLTLSTCADGEVEDERFEWVAPDQPMLGDEPPF